MNKMIYIAILSMAAALCVSCNSQKETEMLQLNEVDITNEEASELAKEKGNENEEVDITRETVDDDADRDDSAAVMDTDVSEPVDICVHVCGAVNEPGVYTVSETTRVYEVLEAAGGLSDTAAADYLNQAAPLADGQRIYVPTVEEVAAGMTAVGELENPVAAANSDAAAAGDANQDVVNINTATAEQLKSLPGVGDARAQSIIAYRESRGGFGTKEEIMQVEGIKEGMYSKMKDRISVD